MADRLAAGWEVVWSRIGNRGVKDYQLHLRPRRENVFGLGSTGFPGVSGMGGLESWPSV